MKVKILLIAFLSLAYLQVNAQKSNDEATLVVSASAATEDEAIKNALRSAIEQTYGTFVSANTTLLNDELVKDEVVTISSGNIKEYSKVGSFKSANGQISVTLKATVCISKLVTYAKSKGASAEFAGATLAMNVKMYELNKNAELKALGNLIEYMKKNLSNAFSRNIQISEPSAGELDGGYDYSEELFNWMTNLRNNYYKIVMTISYDVNKNTESFITYINNALESISINENEYNSIRDLGIETTSARFPFIRKNFKFRNNGEKLNELGRELLKSFDDAFGHFYVVDNLGGRSLVSYNFDPDNLPQSQKRLEACSSGVLSPYYILENNFYSCSFSSSSLLNNSFVFYLGRLNNFKLTFFIPKEKIGQYSKFTIE